MSRAPVSLVSVKRGVSTTAVIMFATAIACGGGSAVDRGVGFGTAGKVRTDFGGADGVSAIAIQSDGKIIAAGGGRGDFALARYAPDGRLDRSFGSGGKVRTNFGGNDAAYAVVIQRDGKIV